MKKMLTFAAALLFCLGAAAQRYAVVDQSCVFIRTAPDYCSSLDCQSLMGTVVTIIDEKDYWMQIVPEEPLCLGWTNAMGLVEMTADQIEAYRRAKKVICRSAHSAVYEDAAQGSDQICDLVMGDVMRQAGTKGAFTKVILPSGKKGYVPSKDLMYGYPADPSQGIVRTAMEFMGIPYLWGGNTTSAADCSGLVWMVYRINGIILPRNASDQARQGMEVDVENAKPGDLLFFEGRDGNINHTGIYIGGGRFIHSSQKVRISSLKASDEDYYSSKKLSCVRRIL